MFDKAGRVIGPVGAGAVVIAVLLIVSASIALDAHDPIGSRVTWTGDIARIFQARCIGCHRTGSVTPMPLTTYDEVRPWTSAIRQQVLSRQMPIWHAARGFGDFANDPSLSPVEIALISAWASAGGPRGTDNSPSLAPEPITPLAAPPARQGRDVPLPCTTQALAGRILAVRPRLAKGGSVTITATRPGGQTDILAWIRDYDPRHPTTYWLRTPLALPPGSRLRIAPTGACTMVVTLAR